MTRISGSTEIGEEVVRQVGPWKEIKTRLALDDMVQKLTEATTAAVDHDQRHALSGGSLQTSKHNN